MSLASSHRLEFARATLAMFLIVGRSAASAEQSPSLPPARQAIILLRALAYDANLKTRAGGTVNIAVLRKGGNAASEAMAAAMTGAFKGLESTGVAGLPVKVLPVAFMDTKALKQSIAKEGIDTLYVCQGLESEIPGIREISRQMKVVTIGGSESHVLNGLSLGVFTINGKNVMELNLQATREEGAAFSGELLRLARVIK